MYCQLIRVYVSRTSNGIRKYIYKYPLILVTVNVVIVEFYLYPTVGTVLIHSVKPELTEM